MVREIKYEKGHYKWRGFYELCYVVQSKIISVRMTIIEKKKKKKNHQKAQPVLVKMWRKGTTRALLVGMQNGTAIVENSMEVPQKVKNRTSI